MASPQPQPLKHKTCVLRVSIHCEGCKRKVSKLLKSIPGVDDVQIDRQLQRAVVTGDVSPESLLRKLVKSGKHAELWPENPPPIQAPKTEKLTSKNEESVALKPEIKPPETKTEAPVLDPPETKPKTEAPAANGGAKGNEPAAVEVKPEEKKPETGSAANGASPAAFEKKEQQTGGGGGGGGEGNVKRKKKKEGQNGNKRVIGEASTSNQPPPEAVTNTVRSANQSPPRQHGYNYVPPQHHVPVYTVSYNTARPPPVNSYTASYYGAGAPEAAYAYSHYGSEMAPPQPQLNVSSEYGPYARQPDSFEMFSDENPNGCLVM